jgi:chemotaxis protein CheX
MNASTPGLIDEVGLLLGASITEVFSTMFDIAEQPAALPGIRGGAHVLVAGSVGFVGEVNGLVSVYVTEPFARTLAGRMLGIPGAAVGGDEVVDDVIGEVSNMIAGSVKSRLCDSGNACVLTMPAVTRGTSLRSETADSSEYRLLTLFCDTEFVLIELLMKNSAQGASTNP